MPKKKKMDIEPLPEKYIDDKRFSLLAPSMSNIVMYADYDADSATIDAHSIAPAAALDVLEAMVITNMCRSMRKLQLSIMAETGEMLPVEVINYHLSLQKNKIEYRREQFAEKQREASWEALNNLAEDPNALRYQRLTNDIAISLERQISALAESNYIADPKTIDSLLNSVEKLMKTDPLYSKGQQRERVKQAGQQAEVTAKAQADAYFSHLANFQKEPEEDADYNELAAYTNDIVARSGGGMDEQTSGGIGGEREADVQEDEEPREAS
jgi:hypothetical protein